MRINFVSRWFGLLQYVARYMLSAMSATTKHASLKKFVLSTQPTCSDFITIST